MFLHPRDEMRSEGSDRAAVLSVTELNTRAKGLLERQLGQVAVAGEISNLRHDRSGHRYFTLKDAGGVLSCALFRQRSGHLNFDPADGMQVIAHGQVTIYSPQGRYQLMVTRLVQAGAGALQAAFDELKRKLAAEGLFAAANKKPLPKVPRRIAVVTSPQGAVWRDMVQVARRRFVHPPLLLVPCRVQGPECVPELLAAIDNVVRSAPALGIDVLVVARGGGSLEDLWGFNDERVARALAACPLVTVSAVGHETDFTIADFVADVRAPTPSAAAELIVPRRHELVLQLAALLGRLGQAAARDVARAQLRLRAALAELGDGQRLLWPATQRLAALDARLLAAVTRKKTQALARFVAAERALARQHPRARLGRQQLALAEQLARLDGILARRLAAARLPLMRSAGRLSPAAARLVAARRARLTTATARLMALSPKSVLGRGYAIATDAEGHIVYDPQRVAAGTALRLQLKAGALGVTATGPLS